MLTFKQFQSKLDEEGEPVNSVSSGGVANSEPRLGDKAKKKKKDDDEKDLSKDDKKKESKDKKQIQA